MQRTIEEINDRIAKRDAVVLTAREVELLIDEGKDKEVGEVDVVTTGTMGLMSGTYASLSFPICRAGVHRRFVKGSINGIPISIGPCPNENLGLVDCIVFGTSRSRENPHYGGGHLFRDIVEGKEIVVEAQSDKDDIVEASVSIENMPTAKLMSSRNLFRNYRAFVNPSSKEVRSIFHCMPFPPDYGGLTFSGCGHFNPIQNDPQLRCIGIGTRLLFNGGEGFVTGAGTRSSPDSPNLMTVAEMKGMDPSLMGGFQTSEGPECIASYAVPIPILDEMVLENVMTRDDRIPLSVVDVRDRSKLAETDYGQAWGHDEVITVVRSECIKCPDCKAKLACPTDAIVFDGEGPVRDPSRCFNCGACLVSCHSGCFRASMGAIRLNLGGAYRTVPIVGRGSNREGALRSMTDLKERILDGRFPITWKVADIRP
ncbi:MAG: methanogenesis marker 16 metalloprotein [Methanomassiliicoccales archaeon]|jgi:putative methanogenesis marker 16 metalloprotein